MIGKKFCPSCGGDNVEMVAGGMTGAWMCVDCGYSGSIFPEKPIVGSKLSDNESEDEEDLDLDEEKEIKVRKKAKKKNIKKVRKVVKKAKKGGKKRRL